MDDGYQISKVYTGQIGTSSYVGNPGMSPTAGELANELAHFALGFFGSANPTPEQKEALSEHLIRTAVRWINDEFELGIPEGPSA